MLSSSLQIAIGKERTFHVATVPLLCVLSCPVLCFVYDGKILMEPKGVAPHPYGALAVYPSGAEHHLWDRNVGELDRVGLWLP